MDTQLQSSPYAQGVGSTNTPVSTDPVINNVSPTPKQTTGFSIGTNNISSNDLLGNYTPSSILTYRNQLQSQYDQNNPFQQNYNAYIQAALPNQQALAGYTAFSPEELQARQRVLQLNQGMRSANANILNRTEPIEFQQGQQAALQRDYGMQLEGANQTLANLEAIRQNNVQAATTMLANQLSNYNAQNTAIQNAQNYGIQAGQLGVSAFQAGTQAQQAAQGRYEFQSITDPNTGFPVIQVIDKQNPANPVVSISPNSPQGQQIMQSGIVKTPQTGTSSYGQQVVSSTLQMSGLTGQDNTPISSILSNPQATSSLIAGIIKQEGGTPQGTNNPGNIKFVGQPGATQGKPASDGGYFANFNTPQDFQNAMKSTLQNYANKGMTLGQAIATYKGVTNQMGADTSKLQQYGKLATTNFNPDNFIDRAANAYLNVYLKNGEQPTASSVGLTNAAMLPQVQKRANDLFTNATGQSLPNLTTLKGNLELLNANNKMLNNLNIQENTVGKNFKMAIDNIDKTGLNQNSPLINSFLNQVKYLMGDPAIAQYIAQNTTLQNEAASLLSVKNSSGTTVEDKLLAAGLIDKRGNIDQQKTVLKTLLKEAQNAQDAIKQSSTNLYRQVDPLAQDSNNPERNKLVSPEGTDETNIAQIAKFRASSPVNNEHVLFLRQQFPNATPLQIRKALGLPAYE